MPEGLGKSLPNDADVIAILNMNVVNALPARTICPGTVNQNNIPNAMLFVLREKSTAGLQQQYDAEGPGHSLDYSRNHH